MVKIVSSELLADDLRNVVVNRATAPGDVDTFFVASRGLWME